jgi:presenilin 1
MILTALAVTYIYTPETFAATQDALTEAYVAFSPPQNASTAVQVGLSVTNALIIVSVICALTFVIVLLYKYRCLKLLIGYMVLSSAALLGVLGGNMFRMAIIVYNLAVDQFSFYFCIYNFALVGVPAIFSPWGGFPIIITQGYLIATSVILAWQLSAFDPWTAWVLLIMLALYDLCAVLTPCGPLKALVNLMSQDDAPDMPGLLYDAELPIEAQRPGRNRASTRATATASTTRQSNDTNSAATVQSTAITTASTQQQESDSEESKSVDSDVVPLVSSFQDIPPATASQHRMSDDAGIEVSRTATDEEAAPPPFSTSGPAPVTVADCLFQTRAAASTTRQSIPVQAITGTEQRQPRPRATLPFAIAKLYKLPLESEEPQQRSSWTPPAEGEHLSPNELLARQYTPEQLCSDVVAIFPRNGGRIEHVGHRYMVKDRHGNLKRVLLMDEQGHVLEERQRTPEEMREQERNSNSIKLGLVRIYTIAAVNMISCLPLSLLFRATLSFILCSFRKQFCMALQLLLLASW